MDRQRLKPSVALTLVAHTPGFNLDATTLRQLRRRLSKRSRIRKPSASSLRAARRAAGGADDSSEVRLDLVHLARQRIAAGYYERNDVLDVAAARLGAVIALCPAEVHPAPPCAA